MARTRECPSCALEVDADADVCPYCGYEFPKQPTSYKGAAWFFVIMAMIWLLYEFI